MPSNRVTSKSPWHIVLVLDDSGSMTAKSGTGNTAACEDLNEAIRELIDALTTASMGQKPYFRVTVISFGSNYQTLAEYVSETDLDENTVASFTGSSGSTNVGAAFEEVERIFKKYPGVNSDFEPFVFFLSDGYPDNANAALDAVDKVKKIDIAAGSPRIVSLGFGDVDEGFMQKLASNSELYKKLDSSQEIIKLLPAIGTIGTQAAGAEDVETAIMNL